MLIAKKICLTLTLALSYTVVIISADKDKDERALAVESLLKKQYSLGENASDFSANTSCGDRYTAYCKLCAHDYKKFLCLNSSEDGRKLVSAYVKSQPKKFLGKAINEENFGPLSLTMSETINTLQNTDIENFFVMRSQDNPERKIVNANAILNHYLVHTLEGYCCCMSLGYGIVNSQHMLSFDRITALAEKTASHLPHNIEMSEKSIPSYALSGKSIPIILSLASCKFATCCLLQSIANV